MSQPANTIRPLIRPVSPGDQGFITSGFCKQLTSTGMSRGDANDTVDSVLDSKIVKILVAGDLASHHDRIIGWIAYVPSFTHGRLLIYLYVRDGYRKHGVAKALTDAAWPQGGGKMLHTFNGPDAKSLLAKFSSRLVSFQELIA